MEKKKPRIKRVAGYFKFKSPTAGEIIFEDLAAVECPGVIDNLNLFMDMIAEEHKCLVKDRKILRQKIAKGEPIDPARILAIFDALILAKEKMYLTAMGKESLKDGEKKD